jgi:hypothetical protein
MAYPNATLLRVMKYGLEPKGFANKMMSYSSRPLRNDAKAQATLARRLEMFRYLSSMEPYLG